MWSTFRLFKIFAIIIMGLLGTISLAVADTGDTGPGGGSEIIPELNELAHQDVTSRLTAYGNDLMGDSIDPATGTLVFSQTDVSLPGNSSLEVAIRRKLTGIDLQAESASFFGNWTLDVPHISMLVTKYANKKDHGPLNTWANRCSGSTYPGTAFDGVFQAEEYWDGMDVSIPGHGSQKVFGSPESSPHIWGNNPTPNKATTSGNLLFSCISNIGAAKGGGEGFNVKTSDGTNYRFDKLKFVDTEPARAKLSGTSFGSTVFVDYVLPRYQAILFATEVSDIYGNVVNYKYDSAGNLTEISGNDGRIITLNYSNNKVSSITANGRTWRYDYAPAAPTSGRAFAIDSLDKVTRPDGKFWHYELDDFRTFIFAPNCEANPDRFIRDLRITHPHGTVGEFKLDKIRHGKTDVPHTIRSEHEASGPDGCIKEGPRYVFRPTFDTISVVEKKLSGPNIDDAVWTYLYDTEYYSMRAANMVPIPEGSTDYKRTTVTDPLGNKLVYYFNRRWGLQSGQLAKVVRKAPDGTILEEVDNEYEINNAIFNYTFHRRAPGAEKASSFVSSQLTKTITKRNNDTFVSEKVYNNEPTSSNYSYGNPIETRTWSNYVISGEANKRITQTTYEHEKDKWILGLPKTVTQNGRLLSTTDYTLLGQVEKRYRYNQTTPVATYSYHSDGTLASVTDAVGRRTEAHDWHRGKPKRVERWKDSNLLQTMGRDVDDNGWLMSQTDAKGRTTSYQRDSMGRLTRITPHRPAPGEGYKLPDTTIHYTFGDTTVQMITTGPKREFVYYDSLLRPVNELTYDFTTAKRIWTRTKYDALGRPIFKSQPSTVPWEAKGVETEYDALGRVTQTRENVAPYATTTHEYLSYHRKKVTDPEGNAVTTYQYGWDGPDSGVPYLIRQHGVTDTWIRRNVHGQIWRVDQNGSSGGFNVNQIQHFYYDAQQRLCRTRTPEGGDTIYRYNEANEVIAYAKGQSAIGYCTSIYDNSAKVNLTYDDLGRLKTTDFADPNTPDIWRDYDANGNITKNYRGQGTSKEVLWDYTYDGNDMLTDEELVIGGSKAFDIKYAYNANGHMYRKYLPSGRGISYFNDGLGRHTKVSWGTETYADNASYHPSGALAGLTFGNGQVFTQELNARLLPKRLRVTKGGADVQNLYYDYYADGRIKHKLDYVDSTYSAIHFYDGAGRLERANSTAWGGATFSYDALGNLREKRFNKNGAIRTVTNNYNSKNRIVGSTDTDNINYGFGYDARGNVTQTGLLNFTYDRSDQPVAMSGTAPNTGTQIDAAYLYDGNMKRVKSVVNGKTIYNVYDLSGRLAHVDEITDGKETDYLHGMGQTLARIKDSGNGDVFTYLHPDHLGSPQAGTTEAGGVSFTEHYTPYGEALISPAANDNQSGFTGHIKDKDTGLNYMQARYYDPNIGRFLSIDPVTMLDTGDPGYFNRYAYTMNDPINLIDPFGEYSTCASFSAEGNAQTCIEVAGVTGVEFDSLDSAASAAGSSLNAFTEQTGNEFGIAFSLNENDTVSPTVAVSGVVDNTTGGTTPGRDASGESGAVSIIPLIAGTENPIGSGHSHPDTGLPVNDNTPSAGDGRVANTLTKLLGAHESIVFGPSGYSQQTSGNSRRGNFGFGPSKFKTRPSSPAAKRRFENQLRSGG